MKYTPCLVQCFVFNQLYTIGLSNRDDEKNQILWLIFYYDIMQSDKREIELLKLINGNANVN